MTDGQSFLPLRLYGQETTPAKRMYARAGEYGNSMSPVRLSANEAERRFRNEES